MAIMKKPAANICMQIFVWMYVIIATMLRSFLCIWFLKFMVQTEKINSCDSAFHLHQNF